MGLWWLRSSKIDVSDDDDDDRFPYPINPEFSVNLTLFIAFCFKFLIEDSWKSVNIDFCHFFGWPEK